MGRVKLAGLAVASSLGLASLVSLPIALAAPVGAAAKAPTGIAVAQMPAAPRPTVTKTQVKTKTVAPPVRCDGSNIANGRPASEMTREPWAQDVLNFPDVWPLTRGEGVKVAVVDSGVDTSHPQLPKVDQYDVTGTGMRPCVGHGTMVAGIIAGQDGRNKHIPFLGVAPKVHLISVKTSIQARNDDPRKVAIGIRRAADLGAKIINVSVTMANFPFLKSAVEYAQRSGALIVAAAGNTRADMKDSEQELYPASYDGVLSVGSIGKDGKVDDFTDTKSRVAVLAPGNAIISTWPGGKYYADSGTSFAAPFVAGTAALVKAYHPELNAQQIKNRIEATADGGTSAGSGHGIVNPLRAVTAILPEEKSQGGASLTPQPIAVLKPPHTDPFTRTVALSVVGGALGIAGMVAAGGVIIPAGRRRNWRPGRLPTRSAGGDASEQPPTR